jgi:hypothetical protein
MKLCSAQLFGHLPSPSSSESKIRNVLTILILAVSLGFTSWSAIAQRSEDKASGQEVTADMAVSANCRNISVGSPPLIDLGLGTYQGYQGGLYLGGENEPFGAYGQIGIQRAQSIQPLNANGQPDARGKIVMLSIGMSNASLEFEEFIREANADPQKNPKLELVNGAVAGQDAEIIKNPNATYWAIVNQRLADASATDKQVQVIWLKEAIKQPTEPFPLDAQHLQNDLAAIVQILRWRFPNLQIIYFASRTYAGYATTDLSPEPYAYESGFAVKGLIIAHIRDNRTSGPWLAWGPYLWTDGLRGRGDGLVWTCDDVQSDGTHPSVSGQQKVAGLLLNFFKTDPTTVDWFVRQ